MPQRSKTYVQPLFSTGSVDPHNFVTLYNPVDSGRDIEIISVHMERWAAVPTDVDAPILVQRISAASGGTHIQPEVVGRYDTYHPDPKAEVRVGGPTATVAPQHLMCFGPPIPTATSMISGVETGQPAGQHLTCHPGEGIVLRTEEGDPAQIWHIILTWAESPAWGND